MGTVDIRTERSYGNGKIIRKKTEWINNMESELRMLEEGLQVNIHSDGLKATLKKIANSKTPGLDLNNQRLADQVWTITKNGWFSDLEILEIHPQIYRQTHQQTPNTVTETINRGKLETPNQTLHDNDPCTANTQTQTLTQEEKTNIDIVRRIMSEKKTTLPSLRDQDWRTVKSETEKVNDFLINIPRKDITELNDLIYAGAKLTSEKIGVP